MSGRLRIRAPPEWGIEPVPREHKILRGVDLFVLWSSLGVGLLVLAAGALLVPGLSLLEALAVSLAGSVMGSVLLASAGLIGSKYGVPTMVSLRPILGVKGSYIPTFLNVVQLVGWTAFELMIMGMAAANISGRFLGDYTNCFWVIVFAICCAALALGGPLVVVRKWLERAARDINCPKGLFVAVVCIYLGTAVGLGVFSVVRAIHGHSSEFPEFARIAHESILQHKDMYTDFAHFRFYPPLFAIVLFPFSLPPVAVGAAAWYAFQFALLLLAARLVASAIDEHLGFSRPRNLIVPLGLGSALVFDSMVRAETDAIVLFGLAAGASYLIRQKDRLGGFWLSSAAAFKATPLIFSAYLFYKRCWRGVVGQLAGVAVFVLILPVLFWGPRTAVDQHVSWIEHILIPYGFKGTTSLGDRPNRSINQSINAAVHRFFTHTNAYKSRRPVYVNMATLDPCTARRVATVLKMIVVMAWLVACWGAWGKTSKSFMMLELTATTLAMLLLSDVSLTSHHAVLLVPYGLVFGVLSKGDLNDTKPLRVGLIVSFAATLLVAFPILKCLSVLTFGTFTFFACVVTVLIRNKFLPRPLLTPEKIRTEPSPA